MSYRSEENWEALAVDLYGLVAISTLNHALLSMMLTNMHLFFSLLDF
jgi:hypothetical protein